jgi:hypothetical protein
VNQVAVPRARAWAVLKGIALGLGIAAVVWLTLGLARSVTFSISTAVTSSPACTSSALFYPGVPRCLTYTVTNPNEFPIKVTRLGVARVRSSAPSSCPSQNLDLRKTRFLGSLTVPATATRATSVPIKMLDDGNQDRCRGAVFSFTYNVALTYRAP